MANPFPHYYRPPLHLLYIALVSLFLRVYTVLFVVFPIPPVHIILTFLQYFFYSLAQVVMFSFSFPPPSRNQLICHIDRSWGCHQLRRILFILLSIYRKSRKIRYFGCRSKRLLFLIILLFSRLLDSSPLHPRLLSSNGLFLGENFIRILHLHPRINDSF